MSFFNQSCFLYFCHEVEKNLNLLIIGPTNILKIEGFDHDGKIFGPTKVEVVGQAPPALKIAYNLIHKRNKIEVNRAKQSS